MSRDLLRPYVAVVDRDTRVLRRMVREIQHALPHGVILKPFTSGKAAKSALPTLRAKGMDPHVVVTDMIGITPARNGYAANVRKEFSRTQIILHSQRAMEDPVAVLDFQNRDKLIDRFIPKEQTLSSYRRLVECVVDCFNVYHDDLILGDMREHIRACRDATMPVTAVAGKAYSLYDMYWEMSGASPVGKQLTETWLLVKMMKLQEGMPKPRSEAKEGREHGSSKRVAAGGDRQRRARRSDKGGDQQL